MKEVAYCGQTNNIRCHHTTFSYAGNLAQSICKPLVLVYLATSWTDLTI